MTLLCLSTIIGVIFVISVKKQSTIYGKIVVIYYNMVEIAITVAV